MTYFPKHIEEYLEETHFTRTEILLLRQLLTGDSLTIRQLAAKMGKSTGTIDQGMKKLIQKRIVEKQMINNTPKYMLRCFDAILEWVQEDTEEKQSLLERKQQDFSSFVDTLKSTANRPDMQYFEGKEGIITAYMHLLDLGDEVLRYLPTTSAAAPEQYRADFFRMRIEQGIYCRTITQNTAKGKEYRQQDPYKNRETLLLPVDTCPITFEKIIIGDTIACFDHDNLHAYLMICPQLATAERSIFETLWQVGKQEEQRLTDAAFVSIREHNRSRKRRSLGTIFQNWVQGWYTVAENREQKQEVAYV